MGLCPSGFQPPMANKYCCCVVVKLFGPIYGLNVLCAQLTRDLFAIVKVLVKFGEQCVQIITPT